MVFWANSSSARLASSARLVQLGDQRFPIVFGGVDFLLARAGFEFGQLGGGLVALGAQFGGVQLDNHLAGLQGVAFRGEDLLHAAAVARGDAGLIGFNRAGDAAGARGITNGAAGGQERQRDHPAHDKAELGLHAAGR